MDDRAEQLLAGLLERLVEKEDEEDEEEAWWEELWDKVEKIRRSVDTIGDKFSHYESSLDQYTRALNRFTDRVEELLDPPHAECDNCGIKVILQGVAHEPNYIQNIGWAVEGKELYCPNCVRIRSGQ